MGKIKQASWCPAVIIILALSACSSPNKPSETPQPPANRAPIITAVIATPSTGVSSLTTHFLSASASDPDGDVITYLWDVGDGRVSTSPTVSLQYQNANTTTFTARLTVTDSQGLTATSTVPIVSATITGTFTGTLLGNAITVTLTQFTGGLVTGTWSQPATGASGSVGPTGQPGTINANREFVLRFKVLAGGSFDDFFYRGTMSSSGQQLTGTLSDSGFTGQTMILTK